MLTFVTCKDGRDSNERVHTPGHVTGCVHIRNYFNDTREGASKRKRINSFMHVCMFSIDRANRANENVSVSPRLNIESVPKGHDLGPP